MEILGKKKNGAGVKFGQILYLGQKQRKSDTPLNNFLNYQKT